MLRCASGLKARAYRTEWSRLGSTPLPAIASLRDGGFLFEDFDPRAARQSLHEGQAERRHSHAGDTWPPSPESGERHHAAASRPVEALSRLSRHRTRPCSMSASGTAKVGTITNG
jgi:hypothetical protein